MLINSLANLTILLAVSLLETCQFRGLVSPVIMTNFCWDLGRWFRCVCYLKAYSFVNILIHKHSYRESMQSKTSYLHVSPLSRSKFLSNLQEWKWWSELGLLMANYRPLNPQFSAHGPFLVHKPSFSHIFKNDTWLKSIFFFQYVFRFWSVTEAKYGDFIFTSPRS